jgi:hypothetical protein
MNHPHNTRVLTRVFSRPSFEALAKGIPPSEVFRNALPNTSAVTVADLFEECFIALQANHRSEYVYKTAIANRIVFGRHSPKTSSLAVELPVGRSIVDVAVFNGTSTAYEIKTELDTPRRLVTQTPDYLRAFERVFIVTHPDLAERYAEGCDRAVGVLALDARESLKVVKPAASNAQTLEARLIFRMLRRSEYLPGLKVLGHHIDLPNGLIAAECERLFSDLPREVAHAIFLKAMRSRNTGSDLVSFVLKLPHHLRVLGYASILSAPQRANLLEALTRRLH